jgi:hypothetical protein
MILRFFFLENRITRCKVSDILPFKQNMWECIGGPMSCMASSTSYLWLYATRLSCVEQFGCKLKLSDKIYGSLARRISVSVKWFAGYMESAFMDLCTVDNNVGPSLRIRISQKALSTFISNSNKIYEKRNEIKGIFQILDRKREMFQTES